MKILFITPSFYPKIGGVEKHVFEVTTRLIEKGHDIYVMTEDSLDWKDKQNLYYHSNASSDGISGKSKWIDISIKSDTKKTQKINVLYFNFGKRSWYKKFIIWWTLIKQRKMLSSFDVIHCHDVFIWYLPLRFIFFNKPVYTTFHGYETYPIRKKEILIRRLSEKLSFGNVCIGDFISKWYGTKPNCISYGGVNIKKTQNSKIKTQKYNNDLNSAVFVGRLDEQTGINTYLQAYKLIKKEIKDFRFEIIGDGPLRREIKEDVNVRGFIENPSKYIISSHFSFVSGYLSILEAIALKRLVFAVFDNPLKEDYLKLSPFTRFIITSNNPSELCKKVIYYLNHPKEEEKLVNLGYNWVKSQTWDNVVDIYLKLWNLKD